MTCRWGTVEFPRLYQCSLATLLQRNGYVCLGRAWFGTVSKKRFSFYDPWWVRCAQCVPATKYASYTLYTCSYAPILVQEEEGREQASEEPNCVHVLRSDASGKCVDMCCVVLSVAHLCIIAPHEKGRTGCDSRPFVQFPPRITLLLLNCGVKLHRQPPCRVFVVWESLCLLQWRCSVRAVLAPEKKNVPFITPTPHPHFCKFCRSESRRPTRTPSTKTCSPL